MVPSVLGSGISAFCCNAELVPGFSFPPSRVDINLELLESVPSSFNSSCCRHDQNNSVVKKILDLLV